MASAELHPSLPSTATTPTLFTGGWGDAQRTCPVASPLAAPARPKLRPGLPSRHLPLLGRARRSKLLRLLSAAPSLAGQPPVSASLSKSPQPCAVPRSPPYWEAESLVGSIQGSCARGSAAPQVRPAPPRPRSAPACLRGSQRRGKEGAAGPGQAEITRGWPGFIPCRGSYLSGRRLPALHSNRGPRRAGDPRRRNTADSASRAPPALPTLRVRAAPPCGRGRRCACWERGRRRPSV